MLDTVTLIQMDIAVRDSRAPTGWIFGTFQYNGAMRRASTYRSPHKTSRCGMLA